MSARPRLPAYSREEIAYCNAIAQAPGALPLALADGEWQLRLRRAGPPGLNGSAEYLEADWGGARFGIALQPGLAERMLRHVLPEAEAAELPPQLRLAVLELLRAEVEAALHRKGGAQRPLRLGAGQAAAAPARHRYAFELTSAKSGETLAGELQTDLLGLSFVAPLLKAAAAPAAEPEWIGAIPVALRFDVGATVLSAAELAALERFDLILLDECAPAPGGEITVRVGPRLGLRGTLQGSTFTVTQPLGKIMAETNAAPAEAGAIDQVPVRLTFDLGERAVTLAELRALKAGFTFDLGRDLRRAVTIRANGQPIGEGELVEIDGVLGVAVTQLGARAAA